MTFKTTLKIIIQLTLRFTFLFVSVSKIYSQNSDTLRIKTEYGWIEKMTNKIALDVSFNNSFERFKVKTQTEKLLLYPNSTTNLSLKMNYRFISFGIKFAPDFLPGNGDDDLKGVTNSLEIGTSLIFKHWYFDISYSKVNGFYLKNSEDFNAWKKGDPYFQFPNLYFKQLSFSSGYLKNSKFSFKSLTSQTERQLKSAGSILPVFNFQYYTIDDKSSDVNTQKSNNVELTLGPGYTYTFVTNEKFYLSMGLQASLGYLNTKLTTRSLNGNINTKQDNFITRWDTKAGIGYNTSNFYTGLYTTISGTSYKQENTTVVNSETRVFYHLFFGIRIKSPDYLNRQMTKIESKIP